MSLTASEREGPVGRGDGPDRYVALRHDALESMEESDFACHPVRPELPHVELAQNEGQAADVIQLRMRGHDHIEPSNPPIPEHRRDHHASRIIGFERRTSSKGRTTAAPTNSPPAPLNRVARHTSSPTGSTRNPTSGTTSRFDSPPTHAT